MSTCLPALGDDDLDAVAECSLGRIDGPDLLPDGHAGIAEELYVLCRRVPPMKGHNGYALFCADANLRVIVEERDEIDVEGRCGLLAHFVDHGTQLLGGHRADPDRPNPSGTAHRKRQVRHAGEGHARTGKRVLAAKALSESRDDIAHVVPL